MLTFVARRILLSIPVIIVASIVLFFFIREAGPNPLGKYATDRDPHVVQRVKQELGLDKPVVVQYLDFAKNFVTGKWGDSFVTNQSVAAEVRSALWNTTQLVIWGIVLSLIVAIAVGVFSAARQYSALDYTFTGLAFIGVSLPVFWFALMAIQILGFDLRNWVHSSQPIFYTVGIHSPGKSGFLDYLRHLALPVLTLSVQLVAGWSRYQRSAMLDVLSADYIRTARAKGVPRRTVLLKHALRNALIPLTTVTAIDIGALFGGLIVTETIFGWPGMGRLFLNSLLNGDTNVLLPWMIVTALFIVGFNLLADIVYGVLDPRIRY
ncbi:MAG TPA: ABC transporter permease [Acidimicrobiales bacterium]|nr:ABC transporter permease [Acidimicrobiales bacterium]